MPFIRVGTCIHCGKCCLREGGLMVENPMIELHEDRCKFYVDELNDEKYGHCLVYDTGLNRIKKAKDRFGTLINKAQIDWFNHNCPPYPSVEDAEGSAQLLSGCGFSFEVSNG